MFNPSPYSDRVIVSLNAHDLEPSHFDSDVWKHCGKIEVRDNDIVETWTKHYHNIMTPVTPHSTRIQCYFIKGGHESLSIDRVIRHRSAEDRSDDKFVETTFRDYDEALEDAWLILEPTLDQADDNWRKDFQSHGLSRGTACLLMNAYPSMWDMVYKNQNRGYDSYNSFLKRANFILEICERYDLKWFEFGNVTTQQKAPATSFVRGKILEAADGVLQYMCRKEAKG